MEDINVIQILKNRIQELTDLVNHYKIKYEEQLEAKCEAQNRYDRWPYCTEFGDRCKIMAENEKLKGNYVDFINKKKEQLIELQEDWDVEKVHSEADDILCDILRELGYNDIVEEFLKVEKWYS